MFDHMAKNTLVPLILRVMLAAIFIYHGQNLVFGEKNELGSNWMRDKTTGEPKKNAQPGAVQLAVAWGQLVGGAAMLLGFLTRIAALGLIAIMVGAISTEHLPNGFDITKGGFEYNLAIIAMAACLVLTGPGPLSLDRFFFRRKHPPA